MNMKKQLMCLSMAMSIMTSMGVTAFASNDVDVTPPANNVICLANNITEETIESITNDISASLVYQDGNTVPVDATIIIENDPMSSRSNPSYVVSVGTSIDVADDTNGELSRNLNGDNEDRGSKVTNNTSAQAWLKMIYSDTSSSAKYVRYIDASLTTTRGTVTSSKVVYGRNLYASTRVTTDVSNTGAIVDVYKEIYSPYATYSTTFANELFALELKVTS